MNNNGNNNFVYHYDKQRYANNGQNGPYVQHYQQPQYPQNHQMPLKQGFENYRPVNVKKNKLPSESTKSFIKFIHVTSYVVYVLALVVLVVGLLLGFLLKVAGDPKTSDSFAGFINKYYFSEAAMVGILFGSLLGLLATALFLVLYVLLFLNHKGWLRKSKAYIPGFLAIVLLFVVSFLALFFSKSYFSQLSVLGYLTNRSETQPLFNVFNTIWEHLKFVYNVSFSKEFNSKLEYGVKYYFDHLAWTSWIAAGAVIVAGVFGNLYYKSIRKTLENSSYFFSRNRW